MKKNDLHFSYPRKIQCVPLVREDLARELKDRLPDTMVRDIGFLANETFSNFLKHAKASDESLYRMSIVIGNDLVRIRVRYMDLAYRGIEAVRPDLTALPSSGFGLYMVSRITDSFETDYCSKTGNLTLEFSMKFKGRKA